MKRLSTLFILVLLSTRLFSQEASLADTTEKISRFNYGYLFHSSYLPAMIVSGSVSSEGSVGYGGGLSINYNYNHNWALSTELSFWAGKNEFTLELSPDLHGPMANLPPARFNYKIANMALTLPVTLQYTGAKPGHFRYYGKAGGALTYRHYTFLPGGAPLSYLYPTSSSVESASLDLPLYMEAGMLYPISSKTSISLALSIGKSLMGNQNLQDLRGYNFNSAVYAPGYWTSLKLGIVFSGEETALHQPKDTVRKQYKNFIYVEGGGSGGVSSINYERCLARYGITSLNIRGGVFYATSGLWSFPTTLIGLIGKYKHKAMVGLGSTIVFTHLDNYNIYLRNKHVMAIFSPSAGYHYQSNDNWFLRVAYTPFLYSNRYDNWFGVSFGYAF